MVAHVDVLEAVVLECGQGLALDLECRDLVDDLRGEALVAFSDQSTLAVAERHDSSAKLDGLESSILSNVARARDSHALTLERLLSARGVIDHVVDVVDQTVASGLGSDQAASP